MFRHKERESLSAVALVTREKSIGVASCDPEVSPYMLSQAVPHDSVLQS